MAFGKKADTFCGSVCYVAPEMFAGGGYTRAVDWWSLGVVLYTMQTGKYPFGEEDETDHLQILKSIQKDQVVLPISLDVDYRSIVHQV